MEKYPLYINGEFVETKATQSVINPATGEICAQVAVAGEAEVESAIRAARNAFDRGLWRDAPLAVRREFIRKISQGILDKAAELARLETLNTGKPIKESTFMDVPSSARSFEYLADNFEAFLKEEKPVLAAQAEAELIREPIGVVVLIIPWNYPLIIASWKLASALAAGNTVILKPSSLTPLTALELARIVHEAGLPAGTVNVVNGPGEKIGAQLCSDKRVDMISFTGSNEVGKKIMEYGAAYPKKTIMELGGKSASIVLEDADIETAVNSSLCAIFLNQGQMCTAMSRILVQDTIYDAFVKDFVQKTRKLRLGSGEDFETQIGPLMSEAQRKKVLAFIEKAQQEGATLACGGVIPTDAKLNRGFFFEPAVITNVLPSMRIFREEVFGPVVCIVSFSSCDEAVNVANNSDYGLAACIWTADANKARDVAGQLNSGTVWINTYGMFYNEVPYGGFKQSGFGKELGREGFLEYTRLKNIIIDRSPDNKPLVNYWYGF